MIKTVLKILLMIVLCLAIILIQSACTTTFRGSSSELSLASTSTTSTSTSTTSTSTSTTPASTSTTPASTSISTTSTLPKPADHIDLADFDWSKITSMRVCHTQSPPYKAITLKQGEKDFDTLLTMLKQINGTYISSSQGLYGGFMPIFLYEGDTKVDRIQISVSEEACFSTDTMREPSNTIGVNTTYASLYTMPDTLLKEFSSFFKSLDYTEDI